MSDVKALWQRHRVEPFWGYGRILRMENKGHYIRRDGPGALSGGPGNGCQSTPECATILDVPTYETILILKPTLSDPEVAELVDKTKQTITSQGGEILSQEIWGRRKLTHMIGKAREGVYAYLKHKSGPQVLNKINHDFAISDKIMRNMSLLAQDRKLKEKKKKRSIPATSTKE